MNIFIYSDESGVFDQAHNEYFVFGGLIFLSKNERDICNRKYIRAEKCVRLSENIPQTEEVKATSISNKYKDKLYRSLNQVEKFGIVVHQKELASRLFDDKKSKQRYLDWAYKIAVKRKFEVMIDDGQINPDDVECLYFYIDEHTTATNGKYELRESLEQEFKRGMYVAEWNTYHEAIFPKLKSLDVTYRDSKSVPLVRAADIISNRLFYLCTNSKLSDLCDDKFNVVTHPWYRKSLDPLNIILT